MRFLLIISILLFVIPAKNFAGTVNVKKFGAKGDGKTDDTKAIQAAIDAAPSGGINMIYFPAGTYVIRSYTSTYNYQENYCLRIHSNIVFKGDGNTSAIKLASHLFDKTDSTANAHIFFGTQVRNIRFSDILIDMNGANNLVPEGVIKNHTAIYIRNGSDVSIKKITIRNCAGRDMIILSGEGSNAIIEQSTFLNGGNYVGTATPNKYQTDFSFIYTEWDSASILNNRIEQKNVDIALCGHTGGIEMHGSFSTATGNKISGCYPGVYISSSYKPMKKTSVKNNQFFQCLKGVSFWVNYPMNEISIINNSIQLTWSRSLKPSIISGIDIPNGNSTVYNFQQANNAPLTAVVISSNTITSLLPDSSNEKSAGMILHSIQKTTINNNKISGMNYGGIVLQGSKWGIDSLVISNNKFSAFKSNNDEKSVGGYFIITDTYSSFNKTSTGVKKVFLSLNTFNGNTMLPGTRTTEKKGGKFFGAFVALPQAMLSEINFENNYFSNPLEKVYRLKTD